MAETTKFWLLVALVCGAFAVAEYMYAREAIRICRDRKRHTLFRILVALVLLVDCLGFLGCMRSEAMTEYIRHLHGCGTSSVNKIAISLLASPISGSIFGCRVLGEGVCTFLLPDLRNFSILFVFLLGPAMQLPGAISFAAQIVRPMVMYKAPKRSWWKIVFVFYVTYLPAAFTLPYTVRELIKDIMSHW